MSKSLMQTILIIKLTFISLNQIFPISLIVSWFYHHLIIIWLTIKWRHTTSLIDVHGQVGQMPTSVIDTLAHFLLMCKCWSCFDCMLWWLEVQHNGARKLAKGQNVPNKTSPSLYQDHGFGSRGTGMLWENMRFEGKLYSNAFAFSR